MRNVDRKTTYGYSPTAIGASPPNWDVADGGVKDRSHGIRYPAGPQGHATGAAGYDPVLNKVQWNVPAMFGGSAAKATSVLSQFNGQGIHIGHYDTGIDKWLPALATHYDASRELIINGVKADPTIFTPTGKGDHGTASAGIMIADASTNGGALTGLSYGATLTSVSIFSGVAGANQIEAIRQMTKFDVTNNSWGWNDKWADSSSTGFGASFQAALKSVADTGRSGLGTVMVHSVGNEWRTDHRDANTQEFSADRHVISVGALSSNGDVTFYSQRGADVLVSGVSGVTTTDMRGAAGWSAGDTTGFAGTSAAAPEVTAIVADMMSANGQLGWRDVENILALTANARAAVPFATAPTGQMAYGWTVNGAIGVNGGGYHFSNDVGFGIANGHDAVREAEVWGYFNSAPQTSANEQQAHATAAATAIAPTATGTALTFSIAKAISIENVSLSLNVSTGNLNNLQVMLISPNGTMSMMLDASTGTASGAYGFNWTLGSHAFLGELSAGTWTVKLIDTVASDYARLNSISLDVYGSTPSAAHVHHFFDEAPKMAAFDPTRLVIHDSAGAGAWLDTAAMTGAEVINLASGATSTLNGKAFVTIGLDTVINNVTLGDGAATVTGNNNGDTVVAGHGAANILGGAGNDRFVSGYGNDAFRGGGGADVFAFTHAGFGRDLIGDFVAGVDRISLKGLGDTFSKLSIADTGSQITISHATAQDGDVIVLLNTNGQHLTASDFVFA